MAESKKLRIFVPHAGDLFTDHLPSGDGLVAFGFVKHLAARGHRLDVASPRIDLRGPVPEGVRLFNIPYRSIRGVATLDYMVRLRRLYNHLSRENDYDIIHQLNPVNTGISISMVGVRKPIVLGNLIPNWTMNESGHQIVGSSKYHPTALIRRTILDWQQRLATAILLTTPAARNRLYITPSVESKIFMLPHGIDDAAFASDGEFTEPSQKNILFVAGLWRRKGIFTLLEAFDQVVAAVPDTKLTIAGDGVERPKVQQYISARGLEGKVRLLGSVTRNDIPSVLKTATVFCLPSYDEPYGMSALEAMAAGRPVVATCGSGLGHILTKEGSVAVRPNDSLALSQALIQVLTAPTYVRAAMGQANRREVAATYAWRSVIPRLESIYQQILARPRSYH